MKGKNWDKPNVDICWGHCGLFTKYHELPATWNWLDISIFMGLGVDYWGDIEEDKFKADYLAFCKVANSPLWAALT